MYFSGPPASIASICSSSSLSRSVGPRSSSTGERSLLELTPERLHERTPLFVGDPGYVDDLEAALN